MNVSQIILFSFLILGLGYELAMHDKPKEGKHNFISKLVATIIFTWLYFNAFNYI